MGIIKTNGVNMRALLVNDVRERISKKFIEQGFIYTPLSSEELHSELTWVFPLGRLKREKYGELEIIEFQFDKYKKPRFTINFGIAPKNGVTLPWGVHLSRDEADVSALHEAYRLYSSVFFHRWFGIGILSIKSKKSVSKLVDNVLYISTEIDDWFKDKKIGKHMKYVGLKM